MTCDEIRDLIDLSALGVLDDADARRVSEHVANCPTCRQALEEAERVAAHVPLALAAASPVRLPPDLKARVIASAMRDVPVAPVASGAPAVAPAPADGITLTLPHWVNRRNVAAAAAVLILFASLAWSVRLSQALDRERSVRERMTALASQQQEIVIEVIDAPDGGKLFLAPTSDDSDAYGKLYTRADLPEVVVMANRLPLPPDGQTYHVWLTTGDRTVHAGTLSLSDEGFGLLIHEAPRSGPVYDAVQVTLQPAEPASPDGEVVLQWPSASS